MLRDHTHIRILWRILRIVYYVDFVFILSQGLMTIRQLLWFSPILANLVFSNFGELSFLQFWRT